MFSLYSMFILCIFSSFPLQFMEQEGNQSLLEFWLAATNFQQQLLEKVGAYDAIEAQNDAIIFYDK